MMHEHARARDGGLARRLAILLMSLIAIAIHLYCRHHHFCMCGHLQHEVVPLWKHAVDLTSMIFFATSAILSLKATIRLRWGLAACLLLMTISRFSIERGGRGVIPGQLEHAVPLGFENWILIVIGFIAVIGLLVPKPPRAEGGCTQCGYNLTGNVSGICPECGEAIEPSSIVRSDSDG